MKMASGRGTRQPISCEPCRVRKIKCARDAIPCSTCIRRRIPSTECVYMGTQHPLPSTKPRFLASPTTLQPNGSPVTASHDVASLVERVQKLEAIIAGQAEPNLGFQNSVSRPLDDTQQFQQGTLRTSASGHVRYYPHCYAWEAGHDSAPRPATDVNDLGSPKGGPFPLWESGRSTLHDLLSNLPPSRLCMELRDIYFSSYASVRNIHLSSRSDWYRYFTYCTTQHSCISMHFSKDTQSAYRSLGLLYSLPSWERQWAH